MAATLITKVAIPHNAVGYNLTDSADFSTLTTGAGNGVKFAYEDDLIVVLWNTTGGSAVYTLKIGQSITKITTYGGSITSPTKTVANGKQFQFRLESIFKNAVDGLVYIECDVAGKVLVQDP